MSPPTSRTMVPDQELPPSPEQLASLRQSFLEMVKERGKDLFEDSDVTRFYQAIPEGQSNLKFTDSKAMIAMRKSSGSMVSSFRVRTGSGTQQVTSFLVTSLNCSCVQFWPSRPCSGGKSLGWPASRRIVSTVASWTAAACTAGVATNREAGFSSYLSEGKPYHG